MPAVVVAAAAAAAADAAAPVAAAAAAAVAVASAVTVAVAVVAVVVAVVDIARFAPALFLIFFVFCSLFICWCLLSSFLAPFMLPLLPMT